MRPLSVYEASKVNGGYLGGNRKRHRFDLSPPPVKKPKAVEHKIPPVESDDSGYETALGDQVVTSTEPVGPATNPGSPAVHIHLHPSQMSEMKKMNRRR